MLKPSKKMLAQLSENDEPIDYSIDSIPLDFANQSQYSDPDLEQFLLKTVQEPYIFIKLIILLRQSKNLP